MGNVYVTPTPPATSRIELTDGASVSSSGTYSVASPYGPSSTKSMILLAASHPVCRPFRFLTTSSNDDLGFPIPFLSSRATLTIVNGVFGPSTPVGLLTYTCWPGTKSIISLVSSIGVQILTSPVPSSSSIFAWTLPLLALHLNSPLAIKKIAACATYHRVYVT